MRIRIVTTLTEVVVMLFLTWIGTGIIARYQNKKKKTDFGSTYMADLTVDEFVELVRKEVKRGYGR